MRTLLFASLFLGAVVPVFSLAADANRLAYLDNLDPYYVSKDFPRLITPQWVGENGVDAVVILAIDDMQKPEPYEKFLRPILDRLKQIDGKAHLSIMTRSIDPKHPQLQKWLEEGVSLETHTIDHPCPLLQAGDFAKAKSTYDRSVDLLSEVPNSHPVAFRMPCCDSKNTPSPRAFAEIIDQTTAKGNFIRIDSSVFNIFSANDPSLPRNLVIDADGRERLRKYLPFESFANTIEDYPYPYVIGKLCWQFPCAVPSDWESFHIQGNASPKLLEDWKAVLDATVLKQGVMTFVFHPYGWSSPQQHVDFINYATSKYGKHVKFLNFREALERLEKNVLGGLALRDEKGKDNGVRLMDLNHDGYIDAIISNDEVHQTRIWSPEKHQWIVSDFPTPLARGGADVGVRFGILDGDVIAIVRNETVSDGWRWQRDHWAVDHSLLNGLDIEGQIFTADHGIDRGVRLHDLDNDGNCELIVGNDHIQSVYRWDESERKWVKQSFTLPPNTSIVDADGRDAGLRLLDVDGDGFDDAIFSNDDHYSLHLFTSMKDGWGKQVLSGNRGDKDAIPAFVRKGTNNGAWFLNRTLWVQNEDTSNLPGQVERRPFAQMLSGVFASAQSPEASLKSIQVRPGFQVELVAAEPLVQDPIAFAWGADGKLWVVEMGDYPLGIDGKGKPGGHVKILEDTNGDGHYVKSTLFLDNLPYPTGVMPWGKGVLITDAPNILYAEDTKGTGKADVVKVLYTGFVEGNPQHRVNGLLYCLDNWIWGANGHSGGVVRSIKTGQRIDNRGRDFRIRPDEGLLETTTGMTQYGHTMDDWGNWFGCDNSNPMYQFVLDERYLRRNPHFAPPKTMSQVSDVPGTAPVYPISPDLPRFNDYWALHRFTSANSVIVYRDDLFGPQFYGNSFVSEPVGNLIHREVLRREGVLFHSSRAADEQKSEFFASFDGWCRPTMLRVGPDGALWVADMYRLVIEHPEWIPKEWQEKLNLRAGHDKGRIYRIYPVGAPPRKIPRLDKLNVAGLVAALDSPSGWQRDMVQQLLVQRHEVSAVPLLEEAALHSNRDLTRLHALCTLDGLGALRPQMLEASLADSQGGVRRHAVRLSEPLLNSNPQLGPLVLKLVSDPDPQVRMQVAYSLGEWDDPRAGTALGQLAFDNRDDQYIEAATMTSLTKKNLQAVLSAFLGRVKDTPPSVVVLSNLLRFAQANGNEHAIDMLIDATTTLRDGRFALWQLETIRVLLDSAGSSRNQPSEKLSAMLKSARALASDASTPQPLRVAAVRLLGSDASDRQADLSVLASLLTPQTPADLQTAAITSLSRMRDATASHVLLLDWKTYSPSLRVQVLDALLNRSEWVSSLLDAMDQRLVLPSDFDVIRRQRLLKIADSSIRERAAKLFQSTGKSDRQQVVEAYQPALKLEGNAAHGAQVFAKTCIPCHHFGGAGNAVGPDLASIGDKSPPTLLVSILDPNRAVEPKYVAYIVQTKDGQTLSGVLGEETATSITFLQANVPPLQILRTDIVQLRSTGMSLMPDGLESGLSQQDLADLIAHIRSGGQPAKPKEFAGNHPMLVTPAADGSILLKATNCEIYGQSLVFEPKFQNLGYWHSDDDSAVWTVNPQKADTYDVWLDYACDKSAAGNLYLLQAGAASLTGPINSTGDWEQFRRIKIGQMTLPAGTQKITFRSNGPINGYLCDLRLVELLPVDIPMLPGRR